MSFAFIEDRSLKDVSLGMSSWSRDGMVLRGNVRSYGSGSNPEKVDDCDGIGITHRQLVELLKEVPRELLEAELARREK